MKEETRTVFVSDDGAIYETEAAAKAADAKLERDAKITTYWSVIHDPDLTEGRGMGARTYVECYGVETWNAEMFMLDWCFKTFGRPVAFVQGCSPITNWTLLKSDSEQYRNPVGQKLGDYTAKPKTVRLTCSGQELVTHE